MEKTALLLVDFQNDYFSSFEGAKYPLVRMEEASFNAGKIIDFFRQKGGCVIHIQHNSPKDGVFFQAGSQGAKIHESVKPLDNEIIITKNFPNSFRQTNLLETLQNHGINSLVIAGAMSHMCIDATVRAASDIGFTCKLINDACATRALEFGGAKVSANDVHASFMAALSFRYATIQKTDDFLQGV